MMPQQTILDILRSGENLSDGEKQRIQKLIEETECNIEVKISEKELEELKQFYWDGDTRPKGMLMLADNQAVYFRFVIV